jgi:hypothetical protein
LENEEYLVFLNQSLPMRLLLIALCLAALSTHSAQAQVPRHVVVEHFTNTRCGICAFRNPGFYANLDNHPQVLRMAVHPSSPYSNCVLNQHNPSQNDARTQAYGIYGGTPRIVVQGDVVSPGDDYGSAARFTPYLNQSSDFELTIKELRYGSDSIVVETWVYARGPSEQTQLRLFVAYLEDTVFYQAPNGENEHYGVFRQALTGSSGDPIDAPATGDSLLLRRSLIPRSEWDLTRMHAIAMLTPSDDLTVLQAGQTSSIAEATTTDLTALQEPSAFACFPNPTTGRLTLRAPQAAVELLDTQGKTLLSLEHPQDGQSLDLSHLPAGLYWLRHGNQGQAIRLHSGR